MAVNPVPRRILPGHEGGSAWGADGAVDIELREQGSLRSQPIQIRRLDLPVAVATQVAPTEVICQNENDIGPSVRAAGRLSGNKRPRQGEQYGNSESNVHGRFPKRCESIAGVATTRRPVSILPATGSSGPADVPSLSKRRPSDLNHFTVGIVANAE
jgi:hypothetical protein